MEQLNKVDAVFEGGGVKGSAFVGAIEATEQEGYAFENLAGTSAGSIVAALIAAGYKASEMRALMDDLDYTKFKDARFPPLFGSIVELIFKKGLYKGDFFEGWIQDLLAQKGVRTFGDLAMSEYQDDPRYRFKLQVIASDISRGRLIVLPRDIVYYGMRPEDLDVARAVRMSMSIPFFYKPVVLRDVYGKKNFVVDGGILSNYPVWIFDEDTDEPSWPTLGYNLVGRNEGEPHKIRSPVSLGGAVFSTMLEAHDQRYIEDENFVRTIAIPSLGVSTIDFGITRQTRQELYESGLRAAKEFFRTWNFAVYKERIRKAPSTGRRARIWTPYA